MRYDKPFILLKVAQEIGEEGNAKNEVKFEILKYCNFKSYEEVESEQDKSKKRVIKARIHFQNSIFKLDKFNYCYIDNEIFSVEKIEKIGNFTTIELKKSNLELSESKICELDEAIKNGSF